MVQGEQSMNESKLDVVRDYFHKSFPGRKITEKHDFDLGVQIFMIARDSGSLLVKIRQNLINIYERFKLRTSCIISSATLTTRLFAWKFL